MERRYSQTEREVLAIVWGCDRFNLYLYGANFEIVTDHKPLELIFNNPNSKPPARIQRWALRLQAYTFTVKYKPGPDLMPFRKVQLELTAANDSDIILRGTRIILPQSLQLRAVKLAHESHQCIVKAKQLLREKVWYPGIDKAVKIEIESCIPCQTTGSATKQEPLQMTELPPAPWKRVSTDFCGTFPSGDHLLVIMDDYSRYPEVEIVRSTAATTILPMLDRIFATHGIPDIVKSDNGPPFSGHMLMKRISNIKRSLRCGLPPTAKLSGPCER